MLMRENPNDKDIPFFPFHLDKSDNDFAFYVKNHLMERPVNLNSTSAEILRLCDGENTLLDITKFLANRYPDSGGIDYVKPKIVTLLKVLSEKELIWWREIPVRLIPVLAPQTIFWEITSLCNLHCLHCVVDAGLKDKRELLANRLLELVEEFASFGVENIAFSGGEPLMHPDFFIIAKKVYDFGMHIQVATNGTLVTRKVARELRDLGAQVQVSLDGSNSLIHNAMRPGVQAFARSVAGIKALVNEEHKVTIGCVLSSLNSDDIPNLLALGEKLGVSAFRLIPFVPKGRGKSHFDIEVSPKTVKKVTLFLREKRKKTKLSISPIEFEELLDCDICDPPMLDQPLKCGGAVSYATITPAGEVLPCHFFEGVRAESVRSRSFSDIWSHSRFLNYFRSLRIADLHGKCRTCSYLSVCAGSCRAVNFSKGDLFGGNRGCWIT